MRLADFILKNVEPILVEWEAFARSIWPSQAPVDTDEVRDDAEKILLETARDMQSDQTEKEQTEKSQGKNAEEKSDDLTRASVAHGAGRVTSGFYLWAVVAEYRALRASVLRLWRASGPTPDLRDVDDLRVLMCWAAANGRKTKTQGSSSEASSTWFDIKVCFMHWFSHWRWRT